MCSRSTCGLAIPTGFIHLPFLPSMVSAHRLEEPSMDLPLMVRAIEIALLAARPDP